MYKFIDNVNALDLCDWQVQDLHKKFTGPTLLRIPGRRKPALFISTLLHGNEWTGFHALQHYFKTRGQSSLARETFLFIGNTLAAAKNVRFTPEQKDMNRIWGQETWTTKLFSQINIENLFACVDIHNNTGRSPHYSIVSKHRNADYNLAALFSPNMIYLETPRQALSIFASAHVPAVTLECGLSDQSLGLEHTVSFLDGLFRLEHIPERRPADHDVNLYETLAVMRVPPGVSFSTADDAEDCEIGILANVVNLNFVECEVGTPLATTRSGKVFDLFSCYPRPRSTANLLTVKNDKIVLADTLVPCMLTEKKEAIEKDCFGYLMKRVGLQSPC